MEMKMTVHEALAKIKTLDKRISDAAMTKFIVANRHNNTRINGKSIKDNSDEYTANMQRLEALIKNRRIIKNAVVMSNAKTEITVAGRTMTVAEAIEEKRFIDELKMVTRTISRHVESEQNRANLENNRVPEAAEKYVASLNMSEKNGYTKDDIKKTMDQYIQDNTWELVDPNKMTEWLNKKEKEFSDFSMNVDFKLSESNATTIITVDLNEEI